MSTRGVIGWTLDGKKYITSYNHSDSYPTWLGYRLCTEFQEVAERLDFETMAKNLVDVKSIGNNVRVTKAYKSELNRLALEEWVGEITPSGATWYEALRNLQGSLRVYFAGIIKVIPGSYEFLRCGYSCEWGWVFNFKEGVLEVYKGLQDSTGPGRYGKYYKSVESYGAHLIAKIPFTEILMWNDKHLKKMMHTLEYGDPDDPRSWRPSDSLICGKPSVPQSLIS